MKRQLSLFCFLLLFYSLISCSPRIRSTISKTLPPLDFKEEVYVLGLTDSIPSDCEIVGEVMITDNGFSVNCSFVEVVEQAKLEARQLGGNVVKITKHNPPSTMGSSCHRIMAKILKVDDISVFQEKKANEGVIEGADYCLLHFYRNGGAGALVGYDIYLGDQVICRAKNKWSETVKVSVEGLNVLWAKTEAKDELPILMEKGREYYIECGLTMGIMVGRPTLKLVENKFGKLEFESLTKAKR